MVFVALGLLVGNRVLGLVDVEVANQFVRLLAVATLALVLFTDAARVKLGRLRRESALPARLLGLGLPLTIVAGTLAGLVLFPQLDLWTAAAWPPSWPPPKPPWGSRWSATSGSPPVSVKASTSKAA